MKNPFEKNDQKVLIAGIVIGSLAAGAAAYLYLKETGARVREQLTGHLGRLRDTFIGGKAEEKATEEAPAYLRHKEKAPKTDREKLKKHEIVPGPGAKGTEGQEEQ